MSAVFAAITIFVFLMWPKELLGLFIDPEDPRKPEILEVGVGLMVMAALFQLADGGQIMAHGMLRGLQDTRMPMVLSAIAYWPIGMGAGYLLGFPAGFGAIGIWSGLVFGLTVAGILLMYRFWRRALPAVSLKYA